MTADEFISAGDDFAELAEQHFRAGNIRAGGEMLFGALSQVIIALAIGRQAPFREHQHRRHLIRALARELDNDNIPKSFRSAQRLHIHFYLGDLPAVNVSDAVADTRWLTDYLRALI